MGTSRREKETGEQGGERACVRMKGRGEIRSTELRA